jgi:hypothetical protein
MIIEDIRFIETPEPIPQTAPFHNSRSLEIITDKGRVTTPRRTTNRAEFMARSGVPLLKALPSEITSDFKLLDQRQISAIMGNTKDSSKITNIKVNK